MRVLFTTSPGLGHALPMAPLAWALRTAGHEVLFVCSGAAVSAVEKAGLPVIDGAPGADIMATFMKYQGDVDPAKGGPPPEDLVGRMFADVSALITDRVVAAAGAWRPDLVVHTVLEASGPLIAARLGVPAVLCGLHLGRGTGTSELLWPHFTAMRERHGVDQLPRVWQEIIIVPPSLCPVAGDDDWRMRHIPYNQGGQLPDWALVRPPRPRICITVGSVGPTFGAMAQLQRLLTDLGDKDVEAVLTTGGGSVEDVPGNVRLVDWIPLSALLPTCSAILHHGGSGTTLAALDAGIPQVVVPFGADQFSNAELIAKSGAGIQRGNGIRPGDNDLSAADLDWALSDEPTRTAATALREEMHAMPLPPAIVPRLEQLG
ncbi:glycosyltransferase [Pseudonocardiaceae bacterium YIM PH 21723]|nr:glycosyltransferase [Pseudonocardiaceae bacterium YIM PH 21723]